MISVIKYRQTNIKTLANIIGAKIIGKDCTINGLNLCNRESQYSSVLSYVNSEDYLSDLISNDKIKAVIISAALFKLIDKVAHERMTFIIESNPEQKFYYLHQYLLKNTMFYHQKPFPAKIGTTSQIKPSAIIEDNVFIGERCVVEANAVIRSGCILGDGVKVGYGSVIGSEGFQLIYGENGIPMLIPHCGGVQLSENVEIGDNSTISKSLFEGFTEVGRNTKIDNSVHIGHNCVIGEKVVVTAGSILLGSVTVKDRVWISPAATIMNGVVLEQDVIVGVSSLVTKSFPAGSNIIGIPARKSQFN
jgi:UDP-3-O-[3-hydroxymyristoyl] glucosamine N-acyltransferase